ELRDALLLTGHTLGQPRDLLVHPQQHRDHRLTALVVDRLRLGALHTTEFAAAALCPADRLNAYTHLEHALDRTQGLRRGGLGRSSTCLAGNPIAPQI